MNQIWYILSDIKKDYLYIKLLIRNASYLIKWYKKKWNSEQKKIRANFYVMKKMSLDLQAKLTNELH